MDYSDTLPRTRQSSRRDFLKASAVGASVLSGLSIARGAHAAGSDVIKIGMVGSGSRCSRTEGADRSGSQRQADQRRPLHGQ